jgi:DSF synthase
MGEQLDLEREHGAWWVWMRPQPRPCFTPGLLAECAEVQAALRSSRQRQQLPEARYLVLGSRVPGVFNLGGDLSLFAQAVRAGDEPGLRRYGLRCVQLMHNQWTGFRQPRLVTIALVQGEALGGGFEAALACNLLVAERGVRFGLPERRFGLFPGMGAYQFLSRRVGAAQAERLILGGAVHSAEELHALGLVDVLAPAGGGEQAVRAWIDAHRRQPAPFDAVLALRRRSWPLRWDELMQTMEQWVNAALALSERDLRLMERLAAAQQGCRVAA